MHSPICVDWNWFPPTLARQCMLWSNRSRPDASTYKHLLVDETNASCLLLSTVFTWDKSFILYTTTGKFRKRWPVLHKSNTTTKFQDLFCSLMIWCMWFSPLVLQDHIMHSAHAVKDTHFCCSTGLKANLTRHPTNKQDGPSRGKTKKRSYKLHGGFIKTIKAGQEYSRDPFPNDFVKQSSNDKWKANRIYNVTSILQEMTEVFINMSNWDFVFLLFL